MARNEDWKRAYVERMTKWQAIGLLAMRPGLVLAIEQLQGELKDLDERIARVNSRHARVAGAEEEPEGYTGKEAVAYWDEELKKAGKKKSSPQAGYWAQMTPGERSKEMKRRMAKGRRKKGAKLHPRDPNHPGHEEWLKKMSKASKAAWAKLSPEEHDTRVAKTLEGRIAS